MAHYFRIFSRLKKHRLAVCGAALILILGLFCVKSTVDTNDGTRMAVIQCLGDYGTFAIDHTCIDVRFDKIVIDGATFSDKPQFLPTLLTPLYLLLKLCGISMTAHPHLTVYLINLLGIYSLNLVLFVLFYRRLLQNCSRQAAAIGSTGLLLSTLLFCYGTTLNNHTPAALALFVLFLLLEKVAAAATPRRLFAAGLAAGVLTALEYIFGGIFLLIGAVLIVLVMRRVIRIIPAAICYGAGAALPLLAVITINLIAYGSILPQYLGTAGNNGTFQPNTSIDWTYVYHALFGDRGIFLYMPLLLLLYFPIREWIKGGLNLTLRLCLLGVTAVTITYLIITNDFGGWCYGFRYLVPAIPIPALAIFISIPWQRTALRLVLGAMLLWGFFIALIGAYNCWPPAYISRKPVNTVIGNLQCILYEYAPTTEPARTLMQNTTGFRVGYSYLLNTCQVKKNHELGRKAAEEVKRMGLAEPNR